MVNCKTNFSQWKTHKKNAYFSKHCFTVLFSVKQSSLPHAHAVMLNSVSCLSLSSLTCLSLSIFSNIVSLSLSSLKLSLSSVSLSRTLSLSIRYRFWSLSSLSHSLFVVLSHALSLFWLRKTHLAVNFDCGDLRWKIFVCVFCHSQLQIISLSFQFLLSFNYKFSSIGTASVWQIASKSGEMGFVWFQVLNNQRFVYLIIKYYQALKVTNLKWWYNQFVNIMNGHGSFQVVYFVVTTNKYYQVVKFVLCMKSTIWVVSRLLSLESCKFKMMI